MKKYFLILTILLFWVGGGCGGGSGSEEGTPNNSPDQTPSQDNTNNTDSQKPTASIVINDGAPTTVSRQVKLSIHAEDNDKLAAYFISEQNQTPDKNDSQWVSLPSVSSTDFELNDYALSSEGGGTKRIYLWVKNGSGNISDAATSSIDVWSFQDLSGYCDNSGDVSMALDSQNKVHFACKNVDRINYLNKQNGIWTPTNLGRVYTSVDRTFPAIAVDNQDVIHVIHSKVDRDSYLFHSWKAAGASSWQVEPITGGDLKGVNSLAIDTNNKLHLTYFAGSGSAFLNYRENASGIWDSFPSSPESTSFNYATEDFYSDLAVDSNGISHLCYSRAGLLRYARKVGSAWLKFDNPALNNQLGDGRRCSIIIGPTDKNYVAYHYRFSERVNGIYVVSFDSMRTFELIHFVIPDSDVIEVGQNISLARDASNRLYLAYYDIKYHGLIYTTGTDAPADTDWFSLLLDVGIADKAIKLLVDSNNKLHLLYLGPHGLTYATTQ